MLARACGFDSRLAHHVGASYVSLAPTFFKSQGALTPLPLLSPQSQRAALRGPHFVRPVDSNFTTLHHVGASSISLAPAFFLQKRRGAPILLPLLSPQSQRVAFGGPIWRERRKSDFATLRQRGRYPEGAFPFLFRATLTASLLPRPIRVLGLTPPPKRNTISLRSFHSAGGRAMPAVGPGAEKGI